LLRPGHRLRAGVDRAAGREAIVQVLVLVLHIVFLTLWSAALLFLPQLLAQQAAAADAAAARRFALMQRWIYAKIMTPSALLTVAAGVWLIFDRGFTGGWLPVKLALVFLMVLFHLYCGYLMANLEERGARRSPLFYRSLPLAPALLITGVVTLVAGKPF
jgi:putative membrane protein